jgi:hypothetical protein
VTYRSSDDGTNATPVMGANGEALLPDVQRPVFVDTLGEDGVTVTRNQYNPASQKYEPVFVDGQPAVVKRVEKVDTTTGVRAGQQLSADEQEKNRQLKAQLAQMADATRKQIAAAQQAIARDRGKLDVKKFATQYPGAGRSVSRDYVLQKYKEFSDQDSQVKLKDVVDSLIKQGFTIQD